MISTGSFYISIDLNNLLLLPEDHAKAVNY